MKKRNLLFTGSIILFSAIAMSYESGPAHSSLNYTGGPGSSSNCVSCHTGSQVPTPTLCTIEVHKVSDSSIVTSYLADTAYYIKLIGSNATSSLTRFGFNFMALRASNTTLNAGTFSGFPTGIDDNMVGTRNIVEQTTALSPTSGNYEVMFNWTAPTAGTGTVNMYAVINAVNNNNNDGTTDRPSQTVTLQLTEGGTTAVSELASQFSINAYPNPVINQLNLAITNATGLYNVKVFGMDGKMVAETTTTGNSTINTSNWASGLYQVQVSKDGAKQTISVLK